MNDFLFYEKLFSFIDIGTDVTFSDRRSLQRLQQLHVHHVLLVYFFNWIKHSELEVLQPWGHVRSAVSCDIRVTNTQVHDCRLVTEFWTFSLGLKNPFMAPLTWGPCPVRHPWFWEMGFGALLTGSFSQSVFTSAAVTSHFLPAPLPVVDRKT